jgi:hypothetical protein
MAHERVVALISSHRVRIARALVRQIRSLSSQYRTVEPAALEMSLQRILVVIARFLETGDEKALMATTTNTAQLRQALGFRVDDFMSAGLSFLPVMRRFIIEHAKDIREGLDDYEAFEAVAIPLLAALVRVFRHAGADHSGIDDDDDADDITIPNKPRPTTATLLPFAIERVTGPASEETPFS